MIAMQVWWGGVEMMAYFKCSPVCSVGGGGIEGGKINSLWDITLLPTSALFSYLIPLISELT